MRERGLQLLSLVVALGVWQLIALWLGANLVPGPVKVLPIVWDLIKTGDFIGPLTVSLQRVAVGFGVAFLFGMIYGIATSRSQTVRTLVTPLATVVMSTTSLVIIFIVLLAIGRTQFSMTLIVALIVFGFIGTPIRDALSGIDEELLVMAESFKSGPISRLLDVYIPYLIPALLATSRIGFNLAWKIVILAEIFGFGTGIGRKISLAYFTFDLSKMLAWLVIFLIVIILIEQVLREYERRTGKWRIVGAR